MKYAFIKLDLKSGEDEFSSSTVSQIEDHENVYDWAREYLMGFWGDATEELPDSEWVTYPNGIEGKIADFRTITEEEYNVLKRFI